MDELEPQKLLEGLFDRKILGVLRLFVNNPEKQFYLREIAKLTRVPIATVFRETKKLCSLAIIKEVRIKQRMKLYQLEETKAAKYIESILEIRRTALEEFVEELKDLAGLYEIILHGKHQKDRASVFIIGHNIDTEAVKRVVASVKEKYHFNLITLTLELDQFEQMSAMGLYSGEKSTLFRKEPEGENG
jgi:delta-aminolevulinic acid dehydratase/porphobilinogen synthase